MSPPASRKKVDRPKPKMVNGSAMLRLLISKIAGLFRGFRTLDIVEKSECRKKKGRGRNERSFVSRVTLCDFVLPAWRRDGVGDDRSAYRGKRDLNE